MTRHEQIRHEFVEETPAHLQEGVLYVSVAHRIAAHSCFCGCGSEVITPIAPTQWELFFDGVTVSLYPSISNWVLECKSHYWVMRNTVNWVASCPEEQYHAKPKDMPTKSGWLRTAIDRVCEITTVRFGKRKGDGLF